MPGMSDLSTTRTASPTFSIPSILAIAAAIGSFFVGSAGWAFVLAIVAGILGVIGCVLALLPGTRGGIISILSILLGAIAVVIAIIRAIA